MRFSETRVFLRVELCVKPPPPPPSPTSLNLNSLTEPYLTAPHFTSYPRSASHLLNSPNFISPHRV